MIKNSIQLKAAFLLVVFALNTVVGFACAVGVDMSFNSGHHHDQEATEKAFVHVHSDGKKHIHQETGNHEEEKPYGHDKGGDHYASKGDKDNCCSDKVIQFEQLDKSIAPAFAYISPVFFTVFVSTFYYKDILYSFECITSVRYFVRSYHPPIPDIVIAIQSFRI